MKAGTGVKPFPGSGKIKNGLTAETIPNRTDRFSINPVLTFQFVERGHHPPGQPVTIGIQCPHQGIGFFFTRGPLAITVIIDRKRDITKFSQRYRPFFFKWPQSTKCRSNKNTRNWFCDGIIPDQPPDKPVAPISVIMQRCFDHSCPPENHLQRPLINTGTCRGHMANCGLILHSRQILSFLNQPCGACLSKVPATS